MAQNEMECLFSCLIVHFVCVLKDDNEGTGDDDKGENVECLGFCCIYSGNINATLRTTTEPKL